VRHVDRQADVASSPQEMFALVADVERYPSFLPWCRSARVLERREDAVIATLQIQRGPLHMQFTTRNQLDPPHAIRLALIEGPFRTLQGEWTFEPREGGGCRVRLRLRFAFLNPLNAWVLEPVFEHASRTLLDAFVKRAQTLHGHARAASM
jgi:ribosome-associated toxin RatA of RatAB toxin-antitoxin module